MSQFEVLTLLFFFIFIHSYSSRPSNVGGFKFATGGAQRPSSASSSSTSAAVATLQQPASSPPGEVKRNGGAAASSSSSSAFVPPEGLSAAWITPPSSSSSSASVVALDVIESFLTESAKIHTSFVRSNFSSSHPYLDGAVTSLYDGFLKSSKQLIIDDKKGGESLSTTHPVNDANRKKEARATLQIEKYSEELKQWTALLKANTEDSVAAASKGGKGGRGAAVDFDDDEMDADLLAKFSIVNDLEVGISEAVESVSNSVTAVTESVRTARRHVRAANAGVKAASTLLRDKIVGGGGAGAGGRVSTKALLKEIVSSGPPSAAKRPPPSSSAAPPSASKRARQ